MKKLIKKVLKEEIKLQEQQQGQGGKVSAKICQPKNNEHTGVWHDANFIKICDYPTGGNCQTPVVGDYMQSRAVTQTGAFLNYDTSWIVTAVNSYGPKDGNRQRYHQCYFAGYDGCTDPNACNYDPNVTNDDGSCYFEGCKHNAASNYNPNATGGCHCGTPPYYDCCIFPSYNCDYNGGCSDPGDGSGTFKSRDSSGQAGTSPNNGVSYVYASSFNGASSYEQAAYNDCLSTCQPQPATYDCVDGSCVIAVGATGQFATEQDCLVGCSPCAHAECFHCPSTKHITSDLSKNDMKEAVQTPLQGCKPIGSGWLQALTSGTNLYLTKADCETAESGCSDKATTPTERCHCCDKQGNVQVMPGQYAVGKCSSIHNIGASLNPTGWISHEWYNCTSVSQPINCGDNNTSTDEPIIGTSAKKSEKGKEEKITQDIREEINIMNRLIKY